MAVDRRGAVLLGGCLVLAACGTGDDHEAVSTEPPPWRVTEVDGVNHADTVPILISDGQEVLTLFLDDDGLLHAATVDASGSGTVAPVADLDLAYPGLGGAVRFGDRWLAMGSGRASEEDIIYDVRVLESADGQTWQEVSTTGLEGAAEVGDLVVTDDRLVAVGTARVGEDPIRGGFLPVAWTSEDGHAWTRVELPLDGATEGGAFSAIALDGRLLAAGRAERRGMLWESRDGSTWTVRDDDVLQPTATIGDIVESQGTVLASAHAELPGEEGEMGRALLLRSTDGGGSWDAVDPAPGDSEGYAPGVRAGGGWFFASKRGRQTSYDLADCYVDIEWCRNPPMIGGSLYASRDGLSWERVDTRGIGDPGAMGIVSGTDDGAVVVFVPRSRDTALWAWPAGTPLTFRDAEPMPEGPDSSGVDVARHDTELEVGRRYALPLGGHCGYEWFGADDRPWRLDGDEVYPMEAPAHWPTAGDLIFGYVRLVDEDTLEYELEDGEVIATFSVPTEDPPGCA